MSTVTIAKTDGDRIVLRDISWQRYLELRDDPAQMRVRMTYHQGVLELMSPSGPHESIKRSLEQMIDCWCEVHDIPFKAFGSTTYRRQDQAAGLEPDSCYYIQSVELIGEKEELDLTIDPPPDLAIEVDIVSSSSGRLPIYAALGVPEVWRTNGDWLRVYKLVGDHYEERPESDALSGLPLNPFIEFVRHRTDYSSLQLIHEFRAWAATQKPSA